jgi:uncharacterized protein (DUF1810 family)
MAAPEQPDNSDPYDLGRFLAAQRDTYADALAEIRAGRKRTHWMWFVFPQIQGLGSSENARIYAITGPDEARAYLAHPVLGPRLLEITGALLGIIGKSAYEIFGSPDDMKLRSSATLFASVSPPGSVFEQILARFFSSQPDPETIRRLASYHHENVDTASA